MEIHLTLNIRLLTLGILATSTLAAQGDTYSQDFNSLDPSAWIPGTQQVIGEAAYRSNAREIDLLSQGDDRFIRNSFRALGEAGAQDHHRRSIFVALPADGAGPIPTGLPVGSFVTVSSSVRLPLHVGVPKYDLDQGFGIGIFSHSTVPAVNTAISALNFNAANAAPRGFYLVTNPGNDAGQTLVRVDTSATHGHSTIVPVRGAGESGNAWVAGPMAGLPGGSLDMGSDWFQVSLRVLRLGSSTFRIEGTVSQGDRTVEVMGNYTDVGFTVIDLNFIAFSTGRMINETQHPSALDLDNISITRGVLAPGTPLLVARNESVSIVGSQAVEVDVLANDLSGNENALSLTQVSIQPSQGTAEIVGGRVQYTPAADFEGTATINYSITDGVETGSATLTLTVSASELLPSIGWVTPFDAIWSSSRVMGWVYLENLPFVYHANFGWIYLYPYTAPVLYAYVYNINETEGGWTWTVREPFDDLATQGEVWFGTFEDPIRYGFWTDPFNPEAQVRPAQ